MRTQPKSCQSISAYQQLCSCEQRRALYHRLFLKQSKIAYIFFAFDIKSSIAQELHIRYQELIALAVVMSDSTHAQVRTAYTSPWKIECGIEFHDANAHPRSEIVCVVLRLSAPSREVVPHCAHNAFDTACRALHTKFGDPILPLVSTAQRIVAWRANHSFFEWADGSPASNVYSVANAVAEDIGGMMTSVADIHIFDPLRYTHAQYQRWFAHLADSDTSASVTAGRLAAILHDNQVFRDALIQIAKKFLQHRVDAIVFESLSECDADTEDMFAESLRMRGICRRDAINWICQN